MGNLLRLLSRDDNPKYDVFVDFENAQPTEIERESYEIVDEVLQYSKDILLELQTYKGAVNEIREAITNPRNESYQTRAWEAVLPLVSKLKRFYEFSQQIDDVVPRILWQLCSGPLPPAQHLHTQQALVKQFAEILDFVLKFDDLKMTNPAIQNDFSYYRRTVSRLRLANQEPIDEELEVPNELANKMSLFYAHATPMLKVLSDATMRFVAENKDLPIENTTETLGTMAKVCQRMIENRSTSDISIGVQDVTPSDYGLFRSMQHFFKGRRFETFNEFEEAYQAFFDSKELPWYFQQTRNLAERWAEFCSRFRNEETILFVLRVMVGLIILYDHVHPVGAFAKSAHIDVKGSIKVLKDQPPNVVEGLLNALRYTTRHLNDESTPKHIKSLLA